MRLEISDSVDSKAAGKIRGKDLKVLSYKKPSFEVNIEHPLRAEPFQ